MIYKQCQTITSKLFLLMSMQKVRGKPFTRGLISARTVIEPYPNNNGSCDDRVSSYELKR
jgi:hypothetical protein